MQDAPVDQRWWTSVREDVREISLRMHRHRVSVAAGGMAFFTALAIAPAAIAFGTIAGLVLDPESVRSTLQDMVERNPALAPLTGVIEPIVGVVTSASSRGFSIATGLGLLVAVYAASRVVVSMRQSLDDAFGIQDQRSGLVQRAIATVITFVGIVLAVVLIAAIAVLPKILAFLQVPAGPLAAVPAAGYLLVLLLTYPLTWALYRFGPHQGIRLPFRGLGVAIAAVGVLAASVGVGLYVQLSSTVGATLAVFGAPIAVLLWLYFVVLALLVGAETTAVRRGSSAGEVTVSQHR